MPNPPGPGGYDANVSPKQSRKAMARSAHKPMHPGFRNLTNFTAPPDGDKIPAEEIAAANPSPEVLDAAARLTPAELEYIFIDAVGSIEVTHPDYVPPNDELLQRAGPLVDFFRKMTGADVEEPMSPQLQDFERRSAAGEFDEKPPRKESVEKQAAQLVEFAKKKAQGKPQCTCGVWPPSEWSKSAHMDYCPLSSKKKAGQK